MGGVSATRKLISPAAVVSVVNRMGKPVVATAPHIALSLATPCRRSPRYTLMMCTVSPMPTICMKHNTIWTSAVSLMPTTVIAPSVQTTDMATTTKGPINPIGCRKNNHSSRINARPEAADIFACSALSASAKAAVTVGQPAR